MRHHNANRKLGRERDQRRALLRSLAVSLIDKETIRTTTAKAKELRPFVEKAVTKAKSKTLESRRFITSYLNSAVAADKLIKVMADKYAERKGGYTRVVKAEPRKLDAAPMSIIQFV
jgi:large subunit ribosomal protein L17